MYNIGKGDHIIMEFKLNKKQRLAAGAASTDISRPVLQNVHIRKGVIEAADGFVLCQKKIDYDGDEKLLLNAKELANLKDGKHIDGVLFDTREDSTVRAVGGHGTAIMEPEQGTFPEVDKQVLSQARGKAVFRTALNRDVLMKLLRCIDSEEGHVVKFYFYTENGPIRVTADDGSVTAIIMPMHVRDWDDDKEETE